MAAMPGAGAPSEHEQTRDTGPRPRGARAAASVNEGYLVVRVKGAANPEYAEYVDRARLNAAKAAGDATLWLRDAQAASDATLGGSERSWTAPVQVVSRTRGLHRLRSNRHSRVRLIMRWVAPDT